ncbi:DUF2397 family protein [Euzebya tangerina]|uniref:DUF2397 family protein n=1 Tax=Euzebya tangerina TaxID=591198 RepID=UPI000E316131|nr:DUF2397 family protein [Euzebya tangerina]
MDRERDRLADIGWSDLPRDLWSFNSGENRRRYLAVLACFDANAFEPALNAELARVDAPELADDAALDATLDQLTTGWGLLTESRDETARYRDPAEFRRRTRQWQLTRDGQAAIATLHGAVAARTRYAALQPAVMDDLAAALSQTVDATRATPPDVGIVHSRLSEAVRTHLTLVENLRTFMQDVNRFLTGVDAGDDEVYAAKQAILSYLQQFVLDADRPAGAIRRACTRIVDVGVDRLAELAVEGANLAPTLTGEDPRAGAVTQLTAEIHGILEWFGADGARLFDGMLPRGRGGVRGCR